MLQPGSAMNTNSLKINKLGIEITGLEGMQLWLRKKKRSSLQVKLLYYHYNAFPSKLTLTSPSEERVFTQESIRAIKSYERSSVTFFVKHTLKADSHTPREKMF